MLIHQICLLSALYGHYEIILLDYTGLCSLCKENSDLCFLNPAAISRRDVET
jgi:hypothetical protein